MRNRGDAHEREGLIVLDVEGGRERGGERAGRIVRGKAVERGWRKIGKRDAWNARRNGEQAKPNGGTTSVAQPGAVEGIHSPAVECNGRTALGKRGRVPRFTR
jgi:hypothetical protein